jgi:hypothetical protein
MNAGEILAVLLLLVFYTAFRSAQSRQPDSLMKGNFKLVFAKNLLISDA